MTSSRRAAYIVRFPEIVQWWLYCKKVLSCLQSSLYTVEVSIRSVSVDIPRRYSCHWQLPKRKGYGSISCWRCFAFHWGARETFSFLRAKNHNYEATEIAWRYSRPTAIRSLRLSAIEQPVNFVMKELRRLAGRWEGGGRTFIMH